MVTVSTPFQFYGPILILYWEQSQKYWSQLISQRVRGLRRLCDFL